MSDDFDGLDDADRRRLAEARAAIASESDPPERARRNAAYQLLKIDLAAKHRRVEESLGDDAEAGGP